MELLDALDTATQEFGRRLALVGHDAWGGPTPCDEWDVHYLVAHVVGGNRFAVSILAGLSSSDAIQLVMSRPQLGDDPMLAWRTTSGDQLDAFHSHGAAERTVDHPLRAMTGAEFLQFRIYDLTLHTWDLARAIGADETLDAGLVGTTLDIVENGAVGTTVTVEPGLAIDPQGRLLVLTGRA